MGQQSPDSANSSPQPDPNDREQTPEEQISSLITEVETLSQDLKEEHQSHSSSASK